MANRQAVMMVIYDLPMLSAAQKAQARLFRKGLMNSGYVMLQRSVYVKLLRNDLCVAGEMNALLRSLPPEGDVSVLPMGLGTFRSLQCLCGTPFAMEHFASDIITL